MTQLGDQRADAANDSAMVLYWGHDPADPVVVPPNTFPRLSAVFQLRTDIGQIPTTTEAFAGLGGRPSCFTPTPGGRCTSCATLPRPDWHAAAKPRTDLLSNWRSPVRPTASVQEPDLGARLNH
jgi:hypothetical protein